MDAKGAKVLADRIAQERVRRGLPATTDRAGDALDVGNFVAVLPHNTPEDSTLEEARSLGAEFFGTVVATDGHYVTVSADDPMRGTVEIRRDLVLVSPAVAMAVSRRAQS